MNALVLTLVSLLGSQGRIHEVSYPPSDKKGELRIGVTYRLWIPDGVRTLRGVIVHQHGCGVGACKGGETAADDLHWQALARTWDCALMGPTYKQKETQSCRLWCDPRNGSDTTFRRALGHFARDTGHPELEKVPWCLWGHSGGGYWASIMLALHPKRVVGAWLRSGTALSGEDSQPELTDEAYAVPIVCNPGVKERDHKRFKRAWNTGLAMVRAFRAKGAPISFAPDPRTGHECGDSRYLAIPFFDACLRLRLPPPDGDPAALRPVDTAKGWRAEILADRAVDAGSFAGKPGDANWLPDERVARAWEEYVKKGVVGDASPPAPATSLKAEPRDDGSLLLTWSANADFESGIRAFAVLRNGKRIVQVPEKPIGRFGRPLFQSMSFHDTPQAPLPKMEFRDPAPEAGAKYTIVVINGAGLESRPSEAVEAP